MRAVAKVRQTLKKPVKRTVPTSFAHTQLMSVVLTPLNIMQADIAKQPGYSGAQDKVPKKEKTKIAQMLTPAQPLILPSQGVMQPYWTLLPVPGQAYFQHSSPSLTQHILLSGGGMSVGQLSTSYGWTYPTSTQGFQTTPPIEQSSKSEKEVKEHSSGVKAIGTEKAVEKGPLKMPSEGKLPGKSKRGSHTEVKVESGNVGATIVSPGMESIGEVVKGSQLPDVSVTIEGKVGDLLPTESPGVGKSEQIPQAPIVPEATAEAAQNVSVAGGLLQQMVLDSSDKVTPGNLQLKIIYPP